jgi:ribonucleoside-diphosphate reductase alpha chain
MQARRWIDSGISKTVNCPEDIPFEAFKDIYRAAYDAGAGCTTYRPNAITGSGVVAVTRLASLATRNADTGRQATHRTPQGAYQLRQAPPFSLRRADPTW